MIHGGIQRCRTCGSELHLYGECRETAPKCGPAYTLTPEEREQQKGILELAYPELFGTEGACRDRERSPAGSTGTSP